VRRALALGVVALGALALAPAGGAGAVGRASAATRVQADEPVGHGRVAIDDGHVDIGPRLLDGRWRIQIRDDSVRPSLWREPSDVVLQALSAARVTVPDERAFRFLGQPGASVWLLPQVQRQGILWPGWNTQDPDVAATIRREASWTLRSVDGPGRFVLFENGAFGAPRVLFDSGRALPQEVGIDADTHVHGNWAFSRPGGYRLAIEMSATTRAGEHLSDRAVLRFFVGDDGVRQVFAATAGAAPIAAAADGYSHVALALGGGAVAVVVLAGALGGLARRRRRRDA
jgi:putative ABC transporter-associated repeat protein